MSVGEGWVRERGWGRGGSRGEGRGGRGGSRVSGRGEGEEGLG